MRQRQLLALTLLAGLLLVPVAAIADNHEEAPEPITWISYTQSQPGKSNDLVAYLAKNGAKIYDPLMADGHIATWGVALPVTHTAGDDWNVMEWVTFRDWAAVDAFMGAFMQAQTAKSPEDRAAEQKEWMSLVESGSHYDEIVRHLHVSRSDGKPAYFDLSYFPVKPGQAESLKDLWVENQVPTMDKLQKAGDVLAYGLAVTSIHDGVTPPSLMFWTALPNLGAMDAISAAMDAADAERDEEAQKELMKSFMSKIDLDGHHDRIMMVVHNGGGDAGGGE